MNDQPLIAVRIKDGIFVGNVTAAHDEEFLYMNKVTHILNCSGTEVRNMFGNDPCIKYLTFPFKDSTAISNLTASSGVMFDTHDRNIDKVVVFIDEALACGECVLVHCVNGLSRSCCIVAAYFVAKYGWKLENALSFLQMAHQEMEILPCWMRQLRLFAKRHLVANDVFDPEVDDSTFALDNDQWMLRNTLLNGLSSNIQEGNALFKECISKNPIYEAAYKPPIRRRRRITYVDTHQGTNVASNVTTPVVNRPVPRHIGRAGDFSGTDGVKALLSGPKERSVTFRELAGSVKNQVGPTGEPILARSVPPNTRGLESPSDVNARGRQQLRLKRRNSEMPSFSRQNSRQCEPTAIRSHTDPVGTLVNDSVATTKQHVPIVSHNPSPADQQQQAVRGTQQSHLAAPSYRGVTNGRGNDHPPQTEVITRTSSNYSATSTSANLHRTESVDGRTQNQHAEPPQRLPGTTTNPQSSQIMRNRATSQDRRRVASTVGSQSNTQYVSAGRPPSTASQQRIVGVPSNSSTASHLSSAAKNAIRSPFTVNSQSKVRIGSPLPQQRKVSSPSQPVSGREFVRVNSGGAPPTMHSSNRTAMSGASNVDTRISRNSSPLTRTGSQTRGASPVLKVSNVVRPSSTIGQRTPVAVTSPRYGGPPSTIVRGQSSTSDMRRPNSPLPQSQRTTTTAIHSAAQNSIKRAPSPIQTGVTRGAYTSQTLSHGPTVSRQSSPMIRGQVGVGLQSNSPMRKRAVSDQYLGALGHSTLSPSGIGARTGVNRRNSPVDMRRY
eukprot:Tbor_TRINITY_DN5595_c1_g1::TRINITY_DN5595_c1_g1_i1::g.13303::m.13303